MSSDENKIQNLNDAKFKKYIDNADFDKLMNLRSLMMRQSVFVRKESYDYVLDRLKNICPHKNCGEETFDTGYDYWVSGKICYDCKTVW